VEDVDVPGGHRLQLDAPAFDWYFPISQAWQFVELLTRLTAGGMDGSLVGLKDGLPAAAEGERVALLGLNVGLRLVTFQ
jgi:hypothetical protein